MHFSKSSLVTTDSLLIFQDGGRPSSWTAAMLILKVRNFNCRYGSEGQYVLPCRISCRSVKPLPRSGRSSIFKTAVTWVGFLPLFVCLFFQTIFQKPMQLGSPNLMYECSTMSPGNPFFGVKCSTVKVTTSVSVFRQNAILPLLRT